MFGLLDGPIGSILIGIFAFGIGAIIVANKNRWDAWRRDRK